MSNPAWFNHPITEKQRTAITRIETMLSIPFSGRVKGDARNYIAKHYDLTKRIERQDVVSANNKILAEILLSKEE